VILNANEVFHPPTEGEINLEDSFDAAKRLEFTAGFSPWNSARDNFHLLHEFPSNHRNILSMYAIEQEYKE
jgi:hypothetical protein